MSDDVDINSPEIQMDDLSGQETTEILEPAKKVRFEIKKATIRTQLEDNKRAEADDNRWKVRRLSLDLAITEGIGDEAKYKGKHLFQDLILTFNQAEFSEQYGSDWWQKRSRGPTKEFFTALGFDVKALPPINADFLSDLVGREVIADIRKSEIRRPNDEGKYVGTGEQENTVQNFRAAE
jgi:hypothetical protein